MPSIAGRFLFCDCVSFFLFFPSFRLHRLSLPSPSLLPLPSFGACAGWRRSRRRGAGLARLSAEREVEAIAAALAAKKEAFVAMRAAAVKSSTAARRWWRSARRRRTRWRAL